MTIRDRQVWRNPEKGAQDAGDDRDPELRVGQPRTRPALLSPCTPSSAGHEHPSTAPRLHPGRLGAAFGAAPPAVLLHWQL